MLIDDAEPIPQDLPDDCVLVPAGSAQRGLWIIQELDSASSAYALGHAFELTGPLDTAALAAAFDDLVTRHETLRTCFRQWDDDLYQVIHADVPSVLSVQEVAAADVGRTIDEALDTPFALDRTPLLRVRLLRVAPAHHVLVVVLHHIIVEGVSVGLLWDDLASRYSAHRDGLASTLPALPLQYADYASWERDWLDSPEYRVQLETWRERLAGAPAAIDLPRTTTGDGPAWQGGSLTTWLSPGLVGSLEKLAQEHRVTRLMVLLMVFAGVLHRWSGQSDVVVGMPVSLRDQPGLSTMVGLMINSVPVRTHWGDDPTATEALERTRQSTVDALANKLVPFDQLVGALPEHRAPGRSPVFQVMFAHQDDADQAADGPRLADVSVRRLPAHNDTAKFELSLDCLREDDRLRCEFEWSNQRLDHDLAELFATHFGNAVEHVAAHVDARVGEWPLDDRLGEMDVRLAEFMAARP
jgi:hypothetical protein